MINVEEVFKDCRRLLSKDKAGYFSSDEFNRFSIMAEQTLFRFYLKHFEEHGLFADTMRQFNELSVLGLDANDRFSLPSDMARRGILWWKKLTNVPGGSPSVERVKIQYLEKEELQDTLDSAIRKPDVTKNRLYFSYVDGKAQVWPSISGPVELDYLRSPEYAERGFTLNATTDEEDYDSSSSTDYEWPDNERQNIVALVLMQYGLVLRENDVVQWSMTQQDSSQNIKQL